MEGVVARKLRPVIESDRLAPRGGQGREEGRWRGSIGALFSSGSGFMEGQDGL